MNNYNFDNLSPIEFESLVKDLLEEEFGISLERFTSGRDGGVDLRHSKCEKNTIIQCKRYGEFNSLYTSLKKEKKKIERVKPSRYVIATSVGLNPERKEKIRKLFSKYIVSTGDIFGREELNDLLRKYEHVERKNFKLWLSSTNILKRILHSSIYNESDFAFEKAKENIRVYVRNDSFTEALDILREKHFVVISGIPGIGKTTLARMLSYYFLTKSNFKEFISLSDSIDAGYKLFEIGKKQVFLFDDFLGTNFLEERLTTNEGKRVVEFIEKIKKSKSKILILTTREYILNQARSKFESIDRVNWNSEKCVIDLSKYTRPIRAMILYNHLYFAGLPGEYISEILIGKRYFKIIDHPNYSPRIIEKMTQQDSWGVIKPELFFQEFKNFLDYPESIWQHAFENQISDLSRVVLWLIATTGTPILLTDLETAVSSFVSHNDTKYKFAYDGFSLRKSIKELENTFINIKKDRENTVFLDFQNPSIYDFLKGYIEKNNLIFDLVKSFVFFNQYFGIFSFADVEEGKIFIKKELTPFFLDEIKKHFDDSSRSSLIGVMHAGDDNSSYRLRYRSKSDLYKISEIILNFPEKDIIDALGQLISQKINSFDFEKISSEDFHNLLSIVKTKPEEIKLDMRTLFPKVFKNLGTVSDLADFLDFRSFYGEEFNEFITDEKVIRRCEGVIDLDIEISEPEDRDELLSRVRDIGGVIPLNVDYQISTLKDLIEEDAADVRGRWEDYDYDDFDPVRDQNEEISDVFDSLREAREDS